MLTARMANRTAAIVLLKGDPNTAEGVARISADRDGDGKVKASEDERFDCGAVRGHPQQDDVGEGTAQRDHQCIDQHGQGNELQAATRS